MEQKPPEGQRTIVIKWFWTAPFPPNCIKISRNASAFREIYYLLIEKVATSKLQSTWKEWWFSWDEEKTAGILCGLRGFLTIDQGKQRLFRQFITMAHCLKGRLSVFSTGRFLPMNACINDRLSYEYIRTFHWYRRGDHWSPAHKLQSNLWISEGNIKHYRLMAM